MQWGTYQPKLGPLAEAEITTNGSAQTSSKLPPGVYSVEADGVVYVVQGKSDVGTGHVSGAGVKLALNTPEPFVVTDDKDAYLGIFGASGLKVRINKRSEVKP